MTGETLQMMESNKEWIFDGVGTTLIATFLAIIGFFIVRKFFSTNTTNSSSVVQISKNLQNTEILFIDDKHFPVINNLKNLGYKIQRINDVNTLNQSELLIADIVFIDIQGVGKKLGLKDQGFGLVKLIREEYKDAKKIVIYSGEESRVNEASRLADKILDKDANVTEFKAIIDDLIIKLNRNA